MAGTYANIEYADMHFMYGKANGNASEAARMYQDEFPARRHPDSRVFTRIHQMLRDKGNFSASERAGRPRTVRNPEVEESVLESVGQDPGTSTRKIAVQENISRSSVWRIMHEQQLYPYHIQRVQSLTPDDFQPRRVFCQWMIQRNVDFTRKILFTDEASFTREGLFNPHNFHQWDDENPKAIVESKHQQRFSLNVWAGIIGDTLIGPFFMPHRMTGATYLHFLQHGLVDLLDEVPLQDLRGHWFMHDGAPPHFLISVRDHLTQKYGGHWIGRGGPVAWPARSPDLNPMDFCIWGYLKTLVYSHKINSIEELQQQIENGFQDIKNNHGLCERIRISLRKRLVSCIEMNGAHFEHLL